MPLLIPHSSSREHVRTVNDRVMATVVLTTLNSRYTHSSLALRYLFANMKELQSSTCILEFTINESIQSIAEALLDQEPQIIGIGVYIWNASEVHALMEILQKIAPHIRIVLGGPEVSHEPFRIAFDRADVIIQGEGDLAFYATCKKLLSHTPLPKIIPPSVVDLATITLPYDYYTDEDIANRYIYVEASRGCPFSCEFCLSSTDDKVRNFNTDLLLEAFERLWQRGVRNFKFIDRTFNLNIRIATRLLDFFLSKPPPYFAHFEVVPDHFPHTLKSKISQFPAGALQLEIGIQTLNPAIALTIDRPLQLEKIKSNIRFLEKETSAHLHLDLIVGLPGESLQSFADNLNLLCSLSQSEIQIGILKKLSGTLMHRHDAQYGMIYSDTPPYDILQNTLLNYKEIQKMKRFARFWDLIYNSGNFANTFTLIHKNSTVFDGFYALSDFIYMQTNSTWKIALDRLNTLLFEYFTSVCNYDPHEVAATMVQDILSVKGRALPKVIAPYCNTPKTARTTAISAHNKRQQKHT